MFLTRLGNNFAEAGRPLSDKKISYFSLLFSAGK
jgi:hypothetical protein